jgi:hypothetical protein
VNYYITIHPQSNTLQEDWLELLFIGCKRRFKLSMYNCHFVYKIYEKKFVKKNLVQICRSKQILVLSFPQLQKTYKSIDIDIGIKDFLF